MGPSKPRCGMAMLQLSDFFYCICCCTVEGYILPKKKQTLSRVLHRLLSSLRGPFSGAMFSFWSETPHHSSPHIIRIPRPKAPTGQTYCMGLNTCLYNFEVLEVRATVCMYTYIYIYTYMEYGTIALLIIWAFTVLQSKPQSP